MPRCTYLSPSGEQKFVWLDDRTTAMVAVLFDATCEKDPARARAAEIAGAVPWGSPSGILAAHALALSAVHVGTTLISAGVVASSRSIDLPLICKLGAELKPLAAALGEAKMDAFDRVGVADDLPAPAGRCRSAHAAVGVVLADVRSRVEPILYDLGLLNSSETPDVLAERARAQGEPLLETLQERLGPEFSKSLVRMWSGWFTIERTLVAEVAGAGQAGLIRAEDGNDLDQARFATAVETVLQNQREAARQYLFSRWRSIVPSILAIRMDNIGGLPLLSSCTAELEAMGKLTAETLQHAVNAKTQAAGLLALMQVLRELRVLADRESRLSRRRTLPELDQDFASQVRALVDDALPRAVRAACGEVDQLSLLPAPNPTRTVRDVDVRAAPAVKPAHQAAATTTEAEELMRELCAITDPVANSDLAVIKLWCQLAEFGTRRLAHAIPDGQRFINFNEGGPSSPPRAWANTMRATTDNVVLLVRRAGRDLDLTALRRLAQRLRAALQGNEIEIDSLLEAIYPVLDKVQSRIAQGTIAAVAVDPWEDQLRELLERGSIVEASRLADDVWPGEDGSFKWNRLMGEVARPGDDRDAGTNGPPASAPLRGSSDSWPPPEHTSVTWLSLKTMEQDVVRVFLKCTKGAVMEVPLVASKARGVTKANRHDYDAAKSLEQLGILKKSSGRTGRFLVALPKNMPPLSASEGSEGVGKV